MYSTISKAAGNQLTTNPSSPLAGGGTFNKNSNHSLPP